MTLVIKNDSLTNIGVQPVQRANFYIPNKLLKARETLSPTLLLNIRWSAVVKKNDPEIEDAITPATIPYFSLIREFIENSAAHTLPKITTKLGTDFIMCTYVYLCCKSFLRPIFSFT